MSSPKGSQIDIQEIIETARQLLANDKGLLAMDESTPTSDERFAAVGIPQTVEARRAYRELILTTPGLGDCISGVILYDETIRQKTSCGIPFIELIRDSGIIPGIKVDLGEMDLAGHPQEKITEGLDGLRERLQEYYEMGARFAKWRSMFVVTDSLPSSPCIEVNADALARYAALCQEAGLLPIVEPEVLMTGNHTLARSAKVTEEVQRTVFAHLTLQGVALEAMLLKPNMVLPGLDCPTQESVERVAEATVRCLKRTVPAAVPGVAFLSGGQSGEQASSRLNAMNLRYQSKTPWALSFSFARAIQQPALEIWKGQDANVPAAQRALYHRASCDRAARAGNYSAAMELDLRVRRISKKSSFGLAPELNRSRKFIAGNWKMNTNAAEAALLAEVVAASFGTETRVKAAVCPPFPYLALVGEILKGSNIMLGAQNLYPKKEGAFTGEVSPTMLLNVGCKYVILGHSERRNDLGETDEFIGEKVSVALDAGLEVILCIGETLQQRKAGQTDQILDRQLSTGLSGLTAHAIKGLTIAYEPIWAIGELGHQATPEQAQEAHAWIRQHFQTMFGEQAAAELMIQYGGSVNPENAAALLCRQGIDGALIGGASLDGDQFMAIVRAGIIEAEITRKSA